MHLICARMAAPPTTGPLLPLGGGSGAVLDGVTSGPWAAVSAAGFPSDGRSSRAIPSAADRVTSAGAGAAAGESNAGFTAARVSDCCCCCCSAVGRRFGNRKRAATTRATASSIYFSGATSSRTARPATTTTMDCRESWLRGSDAMATAAQPWSRTKHQTARGPSCRR